MGKVGWGGGVGICSGKGEGQSCYHLQLSTILVRYCNIIDCYALNTVNSVVLALKILEINKHVQVSVI